MLDLEGRNLVVVVQVPQVGISVVCDRQEEHLNLRQRSSSRTAQVHDELHHVGCVRACHYNWTLSLRTYSPQART